jgi:putative redox protein
MVRIEIGYEGNLRTVSRHGPSGCELATDAPRDNEGRGESFSPTDLVATALGTCMLTVMGIVARRNEWPLTGASASVEKHMVADPDRRVGRLVVRFRMPRALPPASHQVLETAARTCPVAKSLNPCIELDVAFDWGDVPRGL